MTRRPDASPLVLATLTCLLAACGGGDESASSEAAEGAAATPTVAQAPGTVQVTAHDFIFEAPDSIPSGWTTFHFQNEGAQTHFFVLDHLPDGRDLNDFGAAAGMPFDSAWHGLQSGRLTKVQAGALLAELLPGWFLTMQQNGGAGLVAPGGETSATVHMAPGTYVMECYVKAPDGTFHTAMGMARQLTVTSADNGAAEPSADLEITFTGNSMDAPAEVPAGTHTVAVHYEPRADAGLTNDVSVVQLGEGQSAEDVVPWMDWMNVEGLQAPAPATFLGGVQELTEGGTAYFTVTLEPGRYAWISENAERGAVQGFTVR